MADSKLTGLTANTTPALTDLLYIVDDPSGTPLGQKITVGNLLSVASATLVTPTISGAAAFSLASSGSLFAHNPTLLDANAKSFRFSVGAYPDGNLPDTRDNVVWSFGYNLGASGRADVTDHAVGIVIESYYVPGGVDPPVAELHLSHIDTAGVEHRWFTAAGNRDGSGGGISLSGDTIALTTYAGAARGQFNLSTGSGNLVLPTGFQILQAGNNTVFLQQRNAADNAYLPLPYINASDQLYITQALRVLGDVLKIESAEIRLDNNRIIQFKNTSGATVDAIRFNASNMLEMGARLAILDGTSGSPAILFANALATGFYRSAANSISVSLNGVSKQMFDPAFLRMGSDVSLVWSSDPSATVAADTGVSRASAGVAEVNNGTPGTFRDLKLRDLIASAGLKTGAPAGGTSGTWKLGVASAVAITSPTHNLEVDIGGTLFYVSAKLTKD